MRGGERREEEEDGGGGRSLYLCVYGSFVPSTVS